MEKLEFIYAFYPIQPLGRSFGLRLTRSGAAPLRAAPGAVSRAGLRLGGRELKLLAPDASTKALAGPLKAMLLAFGPTGPLPFLLEIKIWFYFPWRECSTTGKIFAILARGGEKMGKTGGLGGGLLRVACSGFYVHLKSVFPLIRF